MPSYNIPATQCLVILTLFLHQGEYRQNEGGTGGGVCPTHHFRLHLRRFCSQHCHHHHNLLNDHRHHMHHHHHHHNRHHHLQLQVTRQPVALSQAGGSLSLVSWYPGLSLHSSENSGKKRRIPNICEKSSAVQRTTNIFMIIIPRPLQIIIMIQNKQ